MPPFFEQFKMLISVGAGIVGEEVSGEIGGCDRDLSNPENFPWEFLVFLVPFVR